MRLFAVMLIWCLHIGIRRFTNILESFALFQSYRWYHDRCVVDLKFYTSCIVESQASTDCHAARLMGSSHCCFCFDSCDTKCYFDRFVSSLFYQLNPRTRSMLTLSTLAIVDSRRIWKIWWRWTKLIIIVGKLGKFIFHANLLIFHRSKMHILSQIRATSTFFKKNIENYIKFLLYNCTCVHVSEFNELDEVRHPWSLRCSL